MRFKEFLESTEDKSTIIKNLYNYVKTTVYPYIKEMLSKGSPSTSGRRIPLSIRNNVLIELQSSIERFFSTFTSRVNSILRGSGEQVETPNNNVRGLGSGVFKGSLLDELYSSFSMGLYQIFKSLMTHNIGATAESDLSKFKQNIDAFFTQLNSLKDQGI